MRQQLHYRPEHGPDAGKHFIITRMAAFQADQWARQTITSLVRNGHPLPKGMYELGLVGLQGWRFENLTTLLDEKSDDAFLKALTQCIRIHRPTKRRYNTSRPLRDQDIADPMTLGLLHKKTFNLHIDFLTEYKIPSTPSPSPETAQHEPSRLIAPINLSLPVSDLLGAGIVSLDEIKNRYDSEEMLLIWEAYLCRHGRTT